MLWESMHPGAISLDIYSWVQRAAGLAPINGRTPTGSYRLHLFKDTLTISHVPVSGDFSLFTTPATYRDQGMKEAVLRVADENQAIIPITWFHRAPLSSHMLLNKLTQTQAWLDWLGPNQGWPPMKPITTIRTH